VGGCCRRSEIEKEFFLETLYHGRSTFSWQKDTPIIVDWLAWPQVEKKISGIPNRLNYYVIFIVHASFTNMAGVAS
jgi:hypothetical protein